MPDETRNHSIRPGSLSGLSSLELSGREFQRMVEQAMPYVTAFL